MTTHCDNCGQKTAMLSIQGERSSQYVCQACGETFERDNPPSDRHEFHTKARLQSISLPAIGGLSGFVPVGVVEP